MESATKQIYKKWLFWIACAVGILVLLLVIGLMIRYNTSVLEEPTQTETTAESTPPPKENPLQPEDFAYQGEYLSCLNVPAQTGVDVSSWQGTIDWQLVAQSGIEFAIIRLGNRGTTLGGLSEDSFARTNYENATAAGLQVGGYFFSQAVTPEEAVEEAEFVLEMIRDWDLQMPIVYDWEYGGADSRTANMDARTLTDCTLAFCRRIENAGYEAMIYFNESQSHQNLYLGELTEYRFWLAQYDQMLDYPYQVDMWQYTCAGAVPGIDGDVDLNLLFDYE